MHEEWGLWDVCVVLEEQIGQDMELWSDGMNELASMVKHWRHSYYDVDIPPVFYIVQRSCDDDSDEDESIEATYFAGCVVQAQLWKRIYRKHILLKDGEEEEARQERYWALKHKVKKHLHDLKNIVGM